MLKMLLTSLSIVFALTMTTIGYAADQNKAAANEKQEESQVIQGTITAINTATRQITVMQEETKQPVTVTLNDIYPNLKTGMRVKIVLKAGTKDQVSSLRVMVKRSKK